MRNEFVNIQREELESVSGGLSVQGNVTKTGGSGKVVIPNDKDRNKCFATNKFRSTKDVERLCGSNAKDREDGGDFWKSVRGVFGLQ